VVVAQDLALSRDAHVVARRVWDLEDLVYLIARARFRRLVRASRAKGAFRLEYAALAPSSTPRPAV
jgi:hypothetical protein